MADLHIDLRSAVVLVPFAQHLAPARRAWSRREGWQPRVETTHTLAAALGPPARADDGQLTLDVTTDRLTAARLLRSQTWVRRDPLAFDEAVASVVTTAHALMKAAAARAPGERAAHWQQGRDVLGVTSGPGASERALARLALEWAALAPPPATDALFGMNPSAWIVVQVGGEDALTATLLARARAAGTPCLLLDADVAVRRSLSPVIAHAVCRGFEHEADCAAAQVLLHLQRGESPVALVAQDRVLVRRVRALLERQHVSLQDETGWKLSTTRAAAQVMTLLRASSPVAVTDLLLDWLKAGAWPRWARAASGLEVACRRAGWMRVSSIDAASLPSDVAELWAEVSMVLETWRAERRRPLAGWLNALQAALRSSGQWDALSTDDAGVQVLRALRLADPGTWPSQAAQTTMNLEDFTAWVDAALEDAAFVPETSHEAPGVVITPLGRLMLRPFAAIVFPGADDQHLGAAGAPQPLLSDAQAATLGVPTRTQRRVGEALAFAHAAGSVPLTLFHRSSDGGEPLSASPLVEQLALRLRRAGREISEWVDPRAMLSIDFQPLAMPAPHAPDLLPPRLSASACEALRACPYRFHALHMLKLRESDELDEEIEARDYGTWLHAVLTAFHESRTRPDRADIECGRLLDIARQQQREHALDDADFLPFEAAFAELAPRYIRWLHERDSTGARFWLGEQERTVEPATWRGISLHGRIDRMDEVQTSAGPAIELIDYKSGSADALRKKVNEPLEDTQLAFYTALMQAETDRPLLASYLALGRDIKAIEHPNVEDTARQLVDGIGDDLARIRQGAGLPALGEGQLCEFCEARGLCRRDHWSATPRSEDDR